MLRTWIILIAISCFIGCSDGNGLEDPSIPEKPAVAISSPPPQPKDLTTVSVIGCFSNVRGDGEHQWGYSVDLWQHGESVVGLVSGTNALTLIGDPPEGLLENVKFDRATGRLSFSAKLSVGLNETGSWSQDVYEFDGTLTKAALKGTLRVTDASCGDTCSNVRNVTLRYSEDMTALMGSETTYDEWKASVDKTLSRRGPKW
jgi:hypothetical protein